MKTKSVEKAPVKDSDSKLKAMIESLERDLENEMNQVKTLRNENEKLQRNV